MKKILYCFPSLSNILNKIKIKENNYSLNKNLFVL